MKVLFVTNVFPPVIGGAGAVVAALARELEDSVVAAPMPATGTKERGSCNALDSAFSFSVLRVPSYMTVLSKRFPKRLRAPLQFAWNAAVTRRWSAAALLKFLSRNHVDIVCINSLLPCYWLPEVLKADYPSLKIVFYVHGEEISGAPQTRLDRLARARLLEADAVVTVSRFTRERALAWGVSPDKVKVIHNGVDIERFTPGPKDLSFVERFDLAQRRILLCLARLDERKGQDTLIAAMPKILDSVPGAVLLLVGGGSDESRLRALSASLGLQDSVRFAGIAREEDLAAFYRLADVYVMPNRRLADGDTEGFGLTFLEAGACGKPVVGGRAGGVPDAIIDGETGFLVDGTSIEEVGDACIRLLRDRRLAASMGRKGLAHAAENTWQKQAGRFRELCRAVRGECAGDTKLQSQREVELEAELEPSA